MEIERYGRYTLIEQIGQGGMSVVYQARDPSLDRFVALKLLHPHLAERADSRARFAREAKAVARLKHPNIMEVFDYAPAESSRSYIVTEYINGPTLRDFLGETPLSSPEAALVLLEPVADALARAHDAGIVHRDVKPENIMIREDGSPVLMDFGIAQMIDMPTLTATGTILGSPAHMAPEVIDGSTIDTPADVFSFGTVLYWAISGYLPFTGPNPSALFRRILETDFDPLSRHSESAGIELSRLVSDCLHKLPEMRPTARQVGARMRMHLENIGIQELHKLRRQLIDDRAKVEATLVDQTVVHLIESAESALYKESIPVVLDLVNRALAHKPHDKRPRKILQRLEKRQRVRSITMSVIGAVIICVPVYFLYQTFHTPIVQLKRSSQMTVLNDGNPNPGLSAAAITAPTIDAATAEVLMPEDKGTGVDLGSQIDAAITIDMQVKRPEPTPQRPRQTVRSKAVNKEKKQNTSTPKTEVTEIPKPLTQLMVSSELQGAQISINGTRHPLIYLSQIRAKGGLKLPPGQHIIEIENLGCKTEAYERQVIPGQKVPPIFHDCKWLDAYLRIETSEGALEIRDRNHPNQRIIGETNQTITLDMNAYKMSKTLMIRRSDDSFVTKIVSLTAGKTTSLPLSPPKGVDP